MLTKRSRRKARPPLNLANVAAEILEPRKLLATISVGQTETDIPAVTAAFRNAYDRQLTWNERNSVYLGTH